LQTDYYSSVWKNLVDILGEVCHIFWGKHKWKNCLQCINVEIKGKEAEWHTIKGI
jgi:hypothetical protein